jgi:hypothetical protein
MAEEHSDSDLGYEVNRVFVNTFYPLHVNLLRVNRLLLLAKRIHNADSFMDQEHDDVLRGAVVLLHAALEEFVREVTKQCGRESGKNYSRVEEIKQAWNPLIGWTSEMEVYSERLERLMKRRHAIAHKADQRTAPDGAKQETPIDYATVDDWAGAVSEFAQFATRQFVLKKT